MVSIIFPSGLLFIKVIDLLAVTRDFSEDSKPIYLVPSISPVPYSHISEKSAKVCCYS